MILILLMFINFNKNKNIYFIIIQLYTKSIRDLLQFRVKKYILLFLFTGHEMIM